MYRNWINGRGRLIERHVAPPVSRPARLNWVAVAAFLIDAATAMAQEPQPYLDETKDAGDYVQDFALFGYSAGAGRLGDPFDPFDDVVACAPQEDEPNVNPTMSNVGAAYLFFDEQVVVSSNILLRRLVSKNPQSGQEMGRLSAVIGNTRGANATNLLFLSGFRTTAIYCNGAEAVAFGGSVEIFDVFDPQPGGQPGGKANVSLVAPLHWIQANPPWLVCNDRVPFEVHQFGQGLVLSDVTGDGVDDLLVGAPATDVGDEVGLGRIYAFAGHTDFLLDPESAWIGLNAPESSDPASNSGRYFGQAMAATRLTDAASGLADIVVGRIDPNPASATPGQPQGGSAIVLRGDYLKSLFDGQDGVTLNTVSDPVFLEDVDPVTPEYQVLPNPFGIYQINAPGGLLVYGDWFGFLVFAVGDIGSPPEDPVYQGNPDGIEDVIIHSEGTDWVGPSPYTPENPKRPNVGANFVYFGRGQQPGNLVDPDHVLLMTPSNVGPPQTDNRFGRGTARVEWLHDRELPLMDIVEPALVISEPDAMVGTTADAGRVHLIRLPLPPQPSPGWVPAPIQNAWGASALTEPGGPNTLGIFGGWILALDYRTEQQQPGQQLLISSRASPVGSRAQAGKFYTFTPYPP